MKDNNLFPFHAGIHHELPVLAVDADDTAYDTRGWFTNLAVSHGATESYCKLYPALSLPDELLASKHQNEALASAKFMQEAAPLPGADYLFRALFYIGYPVFILTHRGYHEDGQRFTEEAVSRDFGIAAPKVIALDTKVSKHEFLESHFSSLSGRGNYLLCDDNTNCRKPDAGEYRVHDRWNRTVVVGQPWNNQAVFGCTRVAHVESILKALLQELHIYAEVRGSKAAKNMYKQLWNHLRVDPYKCPEHHEEHRAFRAANFAVAPEGIDLIK